MMTQGRAAPGRGQPASVVDFTQRRIERALRERARYRYVSPRVLRDADGFRIESPCCSRNVDPGGGVIDIARLARPRRALEPVRPRSCSAPLVVAVRKRRSRPAAGAAVRRRRARVLAVTHDGERR
jgi:hypothetical protein